MSVEIIVEPVSSWKQLPAIPLPQRCGASSAPRPQPQPQPQPRCPPGCMPAENGQLPPGFRRVSRDSLSPRLNRIIDEQLKKIADGQQRQQRRQSKQQQQLIQQQRQQQQNHYQQYQHQQNGLARAHSEAALSPSTFHTRSPQPIIADAARASGYALSHATSISASVDQLPAAIKEVLSVADNIIPEPGKVTYISSSTCQSACNQQQEQHHQQYDPCGEPEQQQQYDPCSEPVSPPPQPKPRPQPRPRPRPVPVRPSSPYEVLPVIHVDRCDAHNPCNQNRQVPADCAPQHSRLTGPAQSNNNNNNCGMTIEIEVSTGNCQ